jgi:hypothetical protein
MRQATAASRPCSGPYTDVAVANTRLASDTRRDGQKNEYMPASPPLSPLGCQFTPQRAKVRSRSDGTIGKIACLDTAIRSTDSGGVLLSAPRAEAAQAPICIRSPQEFWHAQLDAIYSRRNPLKRGTISDLLSKYKGREVLLYRKVCKTYDLCPKKFYADPKAWATLDGDTLEACAAACSSTLGRGKKVLNGLANLFQLASCRRSALETAQSGSVPGPYIESSKERPRTIPTFGEACKTSASDSISVSSEKASIQGTFPACGTIGEKQQDRNGNWKWDHGVSETGSASSSALCSTTRNDSGNKHPFAFQFQQGSAVFGPLRVDRKSTAPLAGLPEHPASSSNPQVSPWERDGVAQQRHASSSVTAQRGMVQVLPSQRSTGISAGNSGLNSRVRVELKRKADRFESPSLSQEPPSKRQFSTSISRCFGVGDPCDNVPSPARSGLWREVLPAHVRELDAGRRRRAEVAETFR